MERRSEVIIGTLIVICFLVAVSVDPIAQDPRYHEFAGDGVLAFGIHNGLNVLSNLPFVLTGSWGFWRLLSGVSTGRYSWGLWGYFLGVFLTGWGSAYYHYQPNNNTLVWDRLPMTLAFMSLMSSIIEFRVSTDWGRRLLPGLLIVGISSVVYWSYTESLGRGDLRPYALVQFGSILLCPVILWRYPKRESSLREALWGFSFYILAKVFENWDGQVLALTGVVAGHPLKHLAAGLASYYFGRFLLIDSKTSPEMK
ncbi:MAG: ceramidase domain-containing protein [Bdellovibrionales bacterium]|nr:ceramidase domain-containing protein [Bdellovibrionales bacterium]